MSITTAFKLCGSKEKSKNRSSSASSRRSEFQSEDAVKRARRCFDLRESYRAQLAGVRSRANEVVDMLFENPFVTARQVAEKLSITPQGALNLVRALQERGWLQE